MLKMLACLVVFRNVCIHQKDFTALATREGFLNACFPAAQRFNLGSRQDNPSLHRVHDGIIVARAAVHRDVFLSLLAVCAGVCHGFFNSLCTADLQLKDENGLVQQRLFCSYNDSPGPMILRFICFLFLIWFFLPQGLCAQDLATTAYREAFRELDRGRYDTAIQLINKGIFTSLNKVLMADVMAQPGTPYSFEELTGFIAQNPDWPQLNGILMIAEQKIPADATSRQVANWFETYPPLTPTGFYRYIEALEALGEQEKSVQKVRERWIKRDFAKGEQTAFHARFGRLLTRKDHQARLSRLVWDNNITDARAMYPYVDKDWQALAEARIALENETSKANALLRKVPAHLENDPGLLYQRVKWRRKANLDNEAMEILVNPPKKLERPDKWWDERHILARRMMEQKNFRKAYDLVSKHGEVTGFDYLEAKFLSGWLALRFLGKPDIAAGHFSDLLKEAQTPISRSRGYYWLGRSYEAAGHASEARAAYEAAGIMNTTFYGQLALTRLDATPEIVARPEPPIPENVRADFFARDMVRAVDALNRLGDNKRTERFFRALCDSAKQRVEFVLLLELAYQQQRADWAVKASKAANQKNMIVPGASFPVLAIEMPTPPEPAMTHALIRQESQFQPDAKSPAGAQGLMQLMPATARETARKLAMPYNPERMTDPDYNIRLGTAFIERQIDAFDGSYVLALAGYNAGPRRARQWMELFGDPRLATIDAVDWIELIPIYETRNYVQRILENLQFYRARLNGGQHPLMILEDIKR